MSDFYTADPSPLPDVDWDKIFKLMPGHLFPRTEMQVEWDKLFVIVPEEHQYAVVQIILRNGVPPDARTDRRETALQVAHKLGRHRLIMKLLITFGADTRACRCWKDTICKSPVEWKYKVVVQLRRSRIGNVCHPSRS
jgi:hypothetical protein